MIKENACNQIRIITKIIALSCLASLILSYKLWLNERSFPTSSIFDFLHPIYHPVDYILFAFGITMLILIILLRNPRPCIILFLLISVVFAIYDMNRWQPWFYQYVLMFFILIFFNYRCDDTKQQNAIVSIFKIMIAVIYFWSGLQKFNPLFITETFPWLMEPITNLLGENSLKHFTTLGYSFPVIESVSGIILLINPIKKLGLVLIISMHVFILLVIGPLGHNYNPVVWPWNIGMVLFSLILFQNEQDFNFSDFRNMLRYHSIKLVFILFVLLPQLNFFNLWDSYLSHNLYSGNTSNGEIYMSEKVENRLPESIKKYCVPNQNEKVIAIKYWCMQELGVPAYPEKLNFENIMHSFYKYTSDSSEIYLNFTPKLKLNERRN